VPAVNEGVLVSASCTRLIDRDK